MTRRCRTSNHCRAITFVFWIFCAICLFAHCEKAGASTAPRPLTRVEQVRQLSQTQGTLAVPVRITGVITAFSGYKNSFFLQDKQFGISVDRTDNAEAHVGDKVEVIGTSSAGLFAPVILASHVQVLGHGSSPRASPMRYSDLLNGAQDSNWIELKGVVHSARREDLFGHPIVHVSLDVDGQPVGILLQDFPWVDENHLVDASVRVRGVCSSDFNVKRQFVAASLFVPARGDFEVLRSTGSNAFAMPIVPIRNVFQFGQKLHRVRVVGVSTYQEPGHVLYLQDGNDGIRIETSSKELSEPGQKVEVVGFPAVGDYSPMLTDGSMRIAGSANAILPLHVEAGKVIRHQDFEEAPYDDQLVEVQGLVVEDDLERDMRILVLRGDNQIFEASLPSQRSARQSKRIEVGSFISVTGICNVVANAERRPYSFTVLMRSPNDIVVLAKASWWTRTHTSAVLITLILFVSATGLWVIVLRYRVREQTRVIRESEHRFRELAETDVLTGLPNRLMLDERIAACLARSESRQLKAAILTIDIDHFKEINDAYGHDVGDECLKIVAQRLRSRVRKVDAISRTGGEEFTEVIGCLEDMESGLTVTNSILKLFREPLALENCELKVTVSIGAALYPDHGPDIRTLRKQSDQALYEAKRLGRNRVVFASKDLTASNALSTSIGHTLVKQPQD